MCCWFADRDGRQGAQDRCRRPPRGKYPACAGPCRPRSANSCDDDYCSGIGPVREVARDAWFRPARLNTQASPLALPSPLRFPAKTNVGAVQGVTSGVTSQQVTSGRVISSTSIRRGEVLQHQLHFCASLAVCGRLSAPILLRNNPAGPRSAQTSRTGLKFHVEHLRYTSGLRQPRIINSAKRYSSRLLKREFKVNLRGIIATSSPGGTRIARV